MTGRLKPKHQRLVLVVIALVVIVGAGILAAWALRNQASYFYVPSQIATDPPAAGQCAGSGRDWRRRACRLGLSGVRAPPTRAQVAKR